MPTTANAKKEAPPSADKWIPRLSLLVALASIGGSIYLQRAAAKDQVKLKRYEVTFLEKRRNFADLNRHLSEVVGVATHPYKVPGDPDGVYRKWITEYGETANKLDRSAYEVQPFLDAEGRRWLQKELEELFSMWASMSTDQSLPEAVWKENLAIMHERTKAFKEELFARLFDEETPDRPK